MTGTALTNALTGGNVTIASTSGSGSDGNINVNDAVIWAANTLTLNATNNIYVNAIMTATGTASFAANYGYLLNNGVPTTTPSGTGFNADGTPIGLYALQGAASGVVNGTWAGKINFSGTGTVTLNGTPYTLISVGVTTTTSGVTSYGLDYVQANPAGNYVLGKDITSVSSSFTGGIGNTTTPFTGQFNGLGHSVTASRTSSTGLFGTIGAGGVVSNFGAAGMINNVVAPAGSSAGLIADINQGTMVNDFTCRAGSNTVNIYSGAVNVGALVGLNQGTIINSYADAGVTVGGDSRYVGGLVGLNDTNGTIIGSFAFNSASADRITNGGNSPLTASTYVGGLVGENKGTIHQSYAKTNFNNAMGGDNGLNNALVGGFVGLNTGTIDQAYVAAGKTSSVTNNFAGFVYTNAAGGTISNAYVDGTKFTSTDVGGALLYGFVSTNAGAIRDSYAIFGSVQGTVQRYGFAQSSTGTLTNTYWSATPTNGAPALDNTAGSHELAAADAIHLANYTFSDMTLWGSSSAGYPLLSQLPVYVRTASSFVYGVDGPTILSSLTASGLQWGDTVAGGQFSLPAGYLDVHAYAAGSVLTSTAYGKILGMIGIAPKALTISGLVQDKTYDGTTSAALNSTAAFSGYVGSQTLNVTYTSAAFSDPNAGTGKTVNLAYTAADGTNGGKASNYVIPTTTTATINKKALATSLTSVGDKPYDGSATESTVSYTVPGVIAGDTVTLNYSAAFSDANVAYNSAGAVTTKTVTFTPISISGSSAGNYTISTTPITTSATITPKVLSLYGLKADDGSTNVPAVDIHANNLVGSDTVTFSGTAKIASAAAGTEPLTDLSGLTVSNRNYTMTGASGNVIVGGANLVLDHVASGTATINTSGSTTTVTTSDRAVIDWLRFCVASGETLTFTQPASTSIVLNRVTTDQPTVIAGMLNANGRVFILNSNGVLFSAGSSVNAGALLATTLNVSDANFQSSNYVFTVASSNNAQVIAAGDIIIAAGGFVVLDSNNGVSHSGAVTATGGNKVLLASTDSLTLDLNPADNTLTGYTFGNLTGATIVGGHLNVGSATGNGLLETVGDTVTLVTNGFSLNTGASGAWSWTQNGSVTIGSGGTLTGDLVSSYLGVRNLSLVARNGDITVNDGVNWSADTLLKLTALGDININQSITATGTNTGLNFTASGGNINVNAPVNWSGGTLSLTAGKNIYVNAAMTASGAGSFAGNFGHVIDANGNPTTTVTGTGFNADGYTPYGVYMGIGYSTTRMPDGTYKPDGTFKGKITFQNAVDGDTARLTLNGTSYTLIKTLGYFDMLDGQNAAGTTAAGTTVSGNYAFANDIDASDVTYIAPLLGNTSSSFTGNLNGLGHTIANLALSGNNTALINKLGVFASNDTSPTLSNIGLVNVTSSNNAGVLVSTNYATVTNSFATGTLSGDGGGLVGGNSGIVTNSWADVSVTGSNGLGGLVGSNTSVFNGTTRNVQAVIVNSNAYGRVTTNNPAQDGSQLDSSVIGGLAGNNSGGLILNSNAYGAVTTLNSYNVGGLVGTNTDLTLGPVTVGTISNSHAYGNVNVTWSSRVGSPRNDSSTYGVGGLVGRNDGSISHSSAAGDVSLTVSGPFGFSSVGGLVGAQNSSSNSGVTTYGTIDNSTATGNVTATGPAANMIGSVGGLVGNNSQAQNSITNSSATGDVIGNLAVGGIGGLVGFNAGIVADSRATGNVVGATFVGGLIGGTNGGSVTGSTATGDVTGLSVEHSTNENNGLSFVGGLIGSVAGNATVTGNSATGSVTFPAGSSAGGLFGVNRSTGDTATGNSYQDVKAEAAAVAAAAAFVAQQEAIFESNGQQTGGQASFSGQGSNSTGQGLNNQIGSFTPSNTGTVNGTMDNHIVYSPIRAATRPL